MQNKKEINAGILIIGNEVLSGRTQDANTSTLAIWLNSLGIPVAEKEVPPVLLHLCKVAVRILLERDGQQDHQDQPRFTCSRKGGTPCFLLHPCKAAVRILLERHGH